MVGGCCPIAPGVPAVPPDISGEWSGEGWGRIVLDKTSDSEYTGRYSATARMQAGELRLQWSRVERRFNGTWREGEERFGEISLHSVGDEIRGASARIPTPRPIPPRRAWRS